MSEVTTKFAARKPLAKIAAQESIRYALGAIFITQSDSEDTVWQVATDGRRLAAIEAYGTTDRPQLCPVDIWPRTNRECQIELNGDWRNSEKRWNDEKRDGKFPRIDQVCTPVAVSDSIEITINPQFLAELAAAIDDDASDGITLIVPKPEKGRHVDSAIRVHGQIDGRSQFGLLMPMAAEKKENIRDWRTEAYNAFCDRLAKVPKWSVDAALDAPECTECTENDSAPETTPEPQIPSDATCNCPAVGVVTNVNCPIHGTKSEPEASQPIDDRHYNVSVLSSKLDAVPDYFGFGAEEIERGRSRFAKDADDLMIVRIPKEHSDWLAMRLGSGMHGARVHPTYASLQETLTEYDYHRSEPVPAEPAPKVEDTTKTETRKPNIVF